MEVAEKTKERSTVILAVLTLLVMGLTVLMSTTQTFRHQREAEEQHLYLTSRAVYLSIESSVRRGPVREGENRLSPRTSDFFQALEQDGDVLFVGIVDERGGKLLTSPLHGGAPIVLPPDMVEEMLRTGEWHGRLVFGDRGGYIYGKRLEPLRGMHMSLRDELGPPGFLVVGIDMEKHLAASAGFRKNVLFQTVYILAAALFTWGLGISFLSRREQARRAAALELFQARLLDNLPDGLITITPDGTIHSANPAALSILKRESRDVLGRPAANLPAALASCIAESSCDRQDWQHITYERAHLEVLVLSLNDRENAWMLILRDRTQLYSLERSLANAEKLAAVGTLAAGVAHEVRNPLSSLRGFAQYFVKKLSGREPEETYAKTMVREADRLNRVITDLLFLGRPKPIAPRQVELAPLMREIATLLRFDLEQRGVTMELRLDAPTLYADADALKQALLNLILNSLDALQLRVERNKPPVQIPPLPEDASTARLSDGNPIMNISGANAPEAVAPGANSPGLTAPGVALPDVAAPGAIRPGADPADAVIVHAVADPAYPSLPDPGLPSGLRVISGLAPDGAWVEVQDTGCGMTREQLSKAFEAFFTAKDNGTGLGLALVQRTMLDHGGAALIASEPGKGCAVRLLFPHAPKSGQNRPQSFPIRSEV